MWVAFPKTRANCRHGNCRLINKIQLQSCLCSAEEKKKKKKKKKKKRKQQQHWSFCLNKSTWGGGGCGSGGKGGWSGGGGGERPANALQWKCMCVHWWKMFQKIEGMLNCNSSGDECWHYSPSTPPPHTHTPSHFGFKKQSPHTILALCWFSFLFSPFQFSKGIS